MTTQVLTHDEVTLLAPAGNFVSTDSLTQLIRDVEAAVLRKVAEPKSKMERTDAFNWQTLVSAMRQYGKLADGQGTFDDVLKVFTAQRDSVLKQQSELQRIKAALGARNDLSIDNCIMAIKNLQRHEDVNTALRNDIAHLQVGVTNIAMTAGCTSSARVSVATALGYVRGAVERAVAWDAVCETIGELDPEYHQGDLAQNHTERVCEWIKSMYARSVEGQQVPGLGGKHLWVTLLSSDNECLQYPCNGLLELFKVSSLGLINAGVFRLRPTPLHNFVGSPVEVRDPVFIYRQK